MLNCKFIFSNIFSNSLIEKIYLIKLFKKIFKETVGVAACKFSNMILGFLCSIILARSLGVESYGAYSFVLSLVGFIALLTFMGFPAYITRQVVIYERCQEGGLIKGLIRRCDQFVLCSSVFFILSIFILHAFGFLYFISNDLRSDLLMIGLLIIPMIAVSNIKVAAIYGFRRILVGSFSQLFFKPLVFFVSIGLIYYCGALSAKNAILAQCISSLISLFLVVFLYNKFCGVRIENESASFESKKWFCSALPFSGIAFTSFINVEFINLFLGFVSTNYEISIFRAAANIAVIVTLPLMVVELVLSPYITRFYYSGDYERLKYLVQLGSLVSLVTSFVPASIFLIYGEEIIDLVYGPEYIAGYPVLVIIVSGYMVVNTVGLSMQLLYATEYQKSAFRISVYGAVLTVFLCILIIPLMGALGAGVALGFGKAIRAILFVIEARRCLKIKTSLIW